MKRLYIKDKNSFKKLLIFIGIITFIIILVIASKIWGAREVMNVVFGGAYIISIISLILYFILAAAFNFVKYFVKLIKSSFGIKDNNQKNE